MQANISSDILKIKIDTHGAELCSVKDYNDTEYLWQADEKVWARHAPVLFPFICNTASKKYTVGGKEYALSNHGFARDSEFEMLYCKDGSAEFYLGYSDDTLKIYPYKFGLYTRYDVDGSRLKVTYTVENKDDKDIFCFIGGHPAFRCPVSDKESYNEYNIVYEKNETITQEQDGKEITLLSGGNTVPVSHELFAHDVFMKDKPESSWIALVSCSMDYKVKLHFDNRGCIAVWSSWFGEESEKTQNAKFVCLEPWSSRPVYCGGSEELPEMNGAWRLSPAEKRAFSFTVEIG